MVSNEIMMLKRLGDEVIGIWIVKRKILLPKISPILSKTKPYLPNQTSDPLLSHSLTLQSLLTLSLRRRQPPPHSLRTLSDVAPPRTSSTATSADPTADCFVVSSDPTPPSTLRCHRLSCEDADAATASVPALVVHCRVQADFSSPDDTLPVPSSPPYLQKKYTSKTDLSKFDGIEEGGIRASLSYSSHEIDEHENEKALEGLQDRVNLLKRVS
ncbi:uncharacterized protein LOC116023345 [Ipomoea triloba]|uniref:uncharacterized protein LOC116023345 n=1 Tax=Ipomoea triloba TaxID=35885 RepID=UPI00125D11A2|nr:uncharacterized protein LOC116023345 [Ipomoea triloba]